MKILFVCAAGMSTSILMKKVEKWGEANQIDLEVKAVGTQVYQDVYQDYDCILIGPQISYMLDKFKDSVSIPVGVISGSDYALGNAENIYKFSQSLISKKGGSKNEFTE